MLRKRAIKMSVRLNEQEHEHLKKQATLSGYPMEPFIRALIMGVTLKHRPPDMYLGLLREMSAIGKIPIRLPELPMPRDTPAVKM